MRVTYDTPGDRPGERDVYTRTEADAGAWETAHAPRPTRLEQAIDAGYEPEDWRE